MTALIERGVIRQARVILWAQWRTIRNYLPRANAAGVAFSAIAGLLWYGGFMALAAVAASVTARPTNAALLARVLSTGLLFILLYWQVVPLVMAASGSSLDLKKLLAYPIPRGALFGLEVMLRVSTGVEMIIVFSGAAIGLWLNPSTPVWSPLWLLPFVLLNLFLGVGLRELTKRLLARRHVRELAAFLLVMVALLPQFLAHTGLPRWVRGAERALGSPEWPWTAVARLAQGRFTWADAGAALAWLAGAYVFGHWQFQRGLRFDEAAARSTGELKHGSRWTERIYRFPASLFRDPVAAVMEKELRTLSRSPRFRLIFAMGFSFGLMIWIPVAFNKHHDPFLEQHYLTLVSAYAVILLSDTLFWNSFGFDRSAAKLYFLAPVRISAVMIGKNLAAVFFLFLEIALVIAVCALLRLPVTPLRLAESYFIALLLALYLLSLGNLTSVWQPRPVNPANALRSSTGGGKIQITLLAGFPLACLPLALAYLARYALSSEVAFFAVLAVDAALGGVLYWVALGSAEARAEREKEQLIAALSRGSGPIAS